jgi:hypothetical protein
MMVRCFTSTFRPFPEFKALAAVRGDICVSLYMPTSPHPDHAHANRVAFKDLAKEAHAIGRNRNRQTPPEPLEQQFDHLVGPDEVNVQDLNHICKLQHKKPNEWDEF